MSDMVETASESTKNDVMSQTNQSTSNASNSSSGSTPDKELDPTELNDLRSSNDNSTGPNNRNDSGSQLNEITSNSKSINSSVKLESNDNDGSNEKNSYNSIGKILNPEERKFYCSVCNQGFTRKHNMVSHELIHSERKPHVCTVCNATFRRIHDLKRHEKLHTGDKPYHCNYCQRKFARPDSLTRHQNSKNACPGLNKIRDAIPELQNKTLSQIQNYQDNNNKFLLKDVNLMKIDQTNPHIQELSSSESISSEQKQQTNPNYQNYIESSSSSPLKGISNHIYQGNNNTQNIQEHSMRPRLSHQQSYLSQTTQTDSKSYSQQPQSSTSISSNSNQLPKLFHDRDKGPFELPPIRSFRDPNEGDSKDTSTQVHNGTDYTTTTTTITTTHRNKPDKDQEDERRKHDYEHQLMVQRYQENQRRSENDKKYHQNHSQSDSRDHQYQQDSHDYAQPKLSSPSRNYQPVLDRRYSANNVNNLHAGNSIGPGTHRQLGVNTQGPSSIQGSASGSGSGSGSRAESETGKMFSYPYQSVPKFQNSNPMINSSNNLGIQSSPSLSQSYNTSNSINKQNFNKNRDEFDYRMYPDEYISISKYHDLVLYTQSLEENLNLIDSRIESLENENADNKIERERAKQIQTEKDKRKKRRKLDHELRHS